jgi:YggT family protein
MPGLGVALVALGIAVRWLFLAYGYVLVFRAVISWVDADPRNPVVRFLHRVTDPPLRAIRGMLPLNLRDFPLDVAFLVLVAFVVFTQSTVAQGLIEAGEGMRARRADLMGVS